MSQENVEFVRRVLTAWNQREHDSVIPLLDPRIVFDASRRRLNPKTYNGMDGMRSMLADRDEVWDEFRTGPEEFIAADDRVVVVGRWVGRGKGSGLEIDQPTAHIFTVRERRIVRWELGHAGRRAALEAAGLSE